MGDPGLGGVVRGDPGPRHRVQPGAGASGVPVVPPAAERGAGASVLVTGVGQVRQPAGGGAWPRPRQPRLHPPPVAVVRRAKTAPGYQQGRPTAGQSH